MPFIVAWAHPDAENKFQKAFPVAQNAIQTQMGTVMDIYPTVLSVAGVKVPENHILDGSTLERMIAGKKDKAHRDDFLMHFPHEHRGSYFTSYRKGAWKLIYYYNPEHPDAPYYKLFNLSEDPYEKNDVAKAERKKAKELFGLMVKRLEMEKALYPIDKDKNELRPFFIAK